MPFDIEKWGCIEEVNIEVTNHAISILVEVSEDDDDVPYGLDITCVNYTYDTWGVYLGDGENDYGGFEISHDVKEIREAFVNRPVFHSKDGRYLWILLPDREVVGHY